MTTEKRIIDEVWKGNIPEYLSGSFVELTEKVIPFWLRNSKLTGGSGGTISSAPYMAVGGRAANVQSRGRATIPSSDWDLLLFTKNSDTADNFTKTLAEFIEGVVESDENLKGVIKAVQHFSTPIGKGHLLWRVAVVDAFSEVKFPIVDLKMCPQEKGGAIGDMCKYVPSNVDGIFYAPRKLVKLDIARMTKLREELHGEVEMEVAQNESNIKNVNKSIEHLILKSNKHTEKEQRDLIYLIAEKSRLEAVDIKHKIYVSNFILKYKRQVRRTQYFL